MVYSNEMNNEVRKSKSGDWIAPLPLRGDVRQLPDSRDKAFKRSRSTKKTQLIEIRRELHEHDDKQELETMDNFRNNMEQLHTQDEPGFKQN